MSVPAQVTEAHLRLANQLVSSPPSPLVLATLIADSEALAIVEIAMVAAASADRNVSLRLERDQLRAELAQLQKNCTDIYDAGRKTEDKLRAEVEQWELAFQEQYARADRAEADLHALRLICGTTDADKFSTWVDRAIARAEKAEADLATAKAIIASIEEDGTEEHNAAVRLRRELATERARLDWLELRGPWDSWNGFGETGITLRENIRAAIDGAMKEGSA